MTTLRRTITWRLAGLAAVISLVTALGIGGCGSDNGTCDYLFANVPTMVQCGAGNVNKHDPIPGSLQFKYDCANSVYTPATGGCQLISCQTCVEADADFDSDL